MRCLRGSDTRRPMTSGHPMRRRSSSLASVGRCPFNPRGSGGKTGGMARRKSEIQFLAKPLDMVAYPGILTQVSGSHVL